MTKFGNGPVLSERFHALDAVRGFALLLGVVFHATLSFIPSPVRFWVVEDIHPSTTLALLCFVIHIFRMTTFFLIAGFFAHMSFHRRGARNFLRDRLLRIALPFLVGWPITYAAIYAHKLWADSARYDGVAPPMPFTLTHLWFLYVLLELYVVVLLLRGVIVWVDESGRIRAGTDRLIRLMSHSRLAPVILALPILIVFTLAQSFSVWLGVKTPDQSLVTNLQASVEFSTAFLFGWLLHRQIDLIRNLERRWLFNLLISVALIAASLAFASPPWPAGNIAIKLADAVCYALAIWTTTFAMIGLALRFLSGFSFVRRYIADASYWIYLIHLPIVIALQISLATLDWPWPMKFATILLVAVPVMFGSYQVFVRYSPIGAVLNGRRATRLQLDNKPIQSVSQVS
jgi:peptidoglycan/LPS O-acetylase OafA/YrhL